MSKASQIIVLCEDRLHEVFVRRFLKRGWGIKGRDVRVIRYPNAGSGGAGEKHVRDRYPYQVRAYRARASKARTMLIVVIDADAGTVQAHHLELEKACDQADPAVKARQAKEGIVHVIPKWHIETWLAYLDGVTVTEDEQYKSGYGFRHRESECHLLVDKLATACKNREELADLPSSLAHACNEFDRIRTML